MTTATTKKPRITWHDPDDVVSLLNQALAAYESKPEASNVEDFRRRITELHGVLSDAPKEAVKQKTVLLGVPYLSTVEPESFLAACCYASANRAAVTVRPHRSSLLAHGLNQLLVEAIREGFDHLCVLHSDLAPRAWKKPEGDPWLDLLIQDMDRYKLDAIHAVAAIKDFRGLTSTGLAMLDEPFGPRKRITVRELSCLPEVFTVADCEECIDCKDFPRRPLVLLPNTGCLVVRTQPLKEKQFPGFTFDDRVKWEDGLPFAETVSEDWNFGYWCARNGVKVGASKRVGTSHFGGFWFESDKEWGAYHSEYDGEPTKMAPGVPLPRRKGKGAVDG